MWLVLLLGALATVTAIIAAPFAVATGHAFIAQQIYQTFSHLCHQIPARSFFVHDHPLAVCARCTGIYSGFALATLIYPLTRSLRNTRTPERKWLLVAAALLAIDVGLDLLGVWQNTHTTRVLTGLLLGGVAVFYVVPGLVELSLRDWRAAKTVARPSTPTLTTTTSTAPSDYSAPHRRI